MRKNDLITYLQSLNGNPTITIWNGLVEDYMVVTADTIHEEKLYKTSALYFLTNMEMEYFHKHKTRDIPKDILDTYKERAKEMSAKAKYEFPNPYFDTEDYKKWYGNRCKNILLIGGELRGKTSYDRCGSIEY
jgi:hypothetical protein